MKTCSRSRLPIVLVILVGSAGCWRANVYPITDEGSSDGGQSAGTVTCPSPARPGGNTNETLQVGTQSRSYVLHIPPSYNGMKAVPLVIDFHGIGNSGASEASSSPYPAVTDPE